MSTNGIPDPLISDTTKVVLIFLAIVGFIAFVIWARYAGPCSWYSGSALSEMPARCLKEMQQP